MNLPLSVGELRTSAKYLQNIIETRAEFGNQGKSTKYIVSVLLVEPEALSEAKAFVKPVLLSISKNKHNYLQIIKLFTIKMLTMHLVLLP